MSGFSFEITLDEATIGGRNRTCSTGNSEIVSIDGHSLADLFDAEMDLEPIQGLGGTAIGWRDRVTGLQFEAEIADHGEGFSGRVLRTDFNGKTLFTLFMKYRDVPGVHSGGKVYDVDRSQYRQSLAAFAKFPEVQSIADNFGEDRLFDLALRGAKACHCRFLRCERGPAGECRMMAMAKAIEFHLAH